MPIGLHSRRTVVALSYVVVEDDVVAAGAGEKIAAACHGGDSLVVV